MHTLTQAQMIGNELSLKKLLFPAPPSFLKADSDSNFRQIFLILAFTPKIVSIGIKKNCFKNSRH